MCSSLGPGDAGLEGWWGCHLFFGIFGFLGFLVWLAGGWCECGGG